MAPKKPPPRKTKRGRWSERAGVHGCRGRREDRWDKIAAELDHQIHLQELAKGQRPQPRQHFAQIADHADIPRGAGQLFPPDALDEMVPGLWGVVPHKVRCEPGPEAARQGAAFAAEENMTCTKITGLKLQVTIINPWPLALRLWAPSTAGFSSGRSVSGMGTRSRRWEWHSKRVGAGVVGPRGAGGGGYTYFYF